MIPTARAWRAKAMNPSEHTDILKALRREFTRVLGDQVASMLLYGSRARGEHRPDSDIDVLVVTHDAVDYGELIRRTSDVVSTLSLENDVVISRAFVSKERFEHEQSPFLVNIRREGIAL
jgi:predicted nucleotidyltransferase